MSKFSKYRFGSVEDPLLVCRNVGIKEQRLLFAIPNGWREHEEQVSVLFTDDIYRMNFILRKYDTAFSFPKLIYSVSYRPVLDEELGKLRTALYNIFDVSSVPFNTVAGIEKFLLALPISKRLIYREYKINERWPI